ncbi:flagellar protein FlaG [Zhongshania aliphaticivorans]|uniref:flagellar protein FlaG n=1 Tax=Zhongshania aliphaticivorans TaxID=1470434 RepID=UPI0012E53E3C|nr:flagellar protein FlaG [Zhongshania aliphaticivorans]CAA0099854.1 Uncharacterised protein [Zhongshania aliphaticivorans]
MDINVNVQTSAGGLAKTVVGTVSGIHGQALAAGSATGNALPQQTNYAARLPVSLDQKVSAVQFSKPSSGSELSRLAAALVTELGTPGNIERTEQAVAKLNEILKDRERDLEFSVDEDTGRTVLKVIHAESGEVIRQIPPEELLNIARVFIEGTGSLIEDQA